MQPVKLVASLINLATLVSALCFCLQAAAAEFKIITLQHRFAEDILPSIQPLVAGNGTATGMQNQLIIRTSAENMLEIERIIATLDVARQNLKITVRRQNSTDASGSNANIGVRKRLGNVEVITGNYPQNSRNSARIQLEERQSKIQSSSEQLLNVTDGERGFISVGQSVPFTQEWVTLTRRYIHIQRTVEFADISTGFAVRPRSVGKQIQVEITPRITQLNNNGIIDFDELSTTVRLTPGEWLDIGGIMQQRDEVSRAILDWQNNQQSQNSQLLICVD